MDSGKHRAPNLGRQKSKNKTKIELENGPILENCFFQSGNRSKGRSSSGERTKGDDAADGGQLNVLKKKKQDVEGKMASTLRAQNYFTLIKRPSLMNADFYGSHLSSAVKVNKHFWLK